MRRAVLLLAAAVGAALAVGAVLALVVDHGTIVGANVLVNAPQPIDANNSPTVTRNPRDAANLVVVHRVDRPSFSALLERSADNGRTWQTRSLPLPEGADRPFAPDAAFGPDGILYVLYAHLEGVANTPANLWMATSSDGGESLSAPVRVSGPLSFQARLAVGPPGVVHVTWLQASDVGLFRLAGPPSPLVASRSDDGGRTFSSPVAVSDPRRERVGAATPVVHAGKLFVLYQDFRGNRRDFENLEGPPWEEPSALVLTSSSDGGRSFSPGVEVEPAVVGRHRFVVFLPPFPSLAAASDGTLHVAWADGRNGDDDVLSRRSPDGGVTWTAPVRVNDNRQGDGTSQYLPRLAVASDGRVDVVFLDRRRDPGDVDTDAWLASSTDQGRTFANLRLSSRSFDSRTGLGTPHGDPDFGSRLGLDSHGGATFAVWTDTRVGDRDSGRQDIVAAQVRRRPRWPLFAWSALGGLVASGALSLGSRRSR